MSICVTTVTETDTVYTIDVEAPYYFLFVPVPTLFSFVLASTVYEVAVSTPPAYEVDVTTPVCYSVTITDIAPASSGVIGLDFSNADNAMYLGAI